MVKHLVVEEELISSIPVRSLSYPVRRFRVFITFYSSSHVHKLLSDQS
ncbi:hypothetical protein [uncultured Bacteroides sp.]|nr:hypothetical protein [uncultured Bacteroides sp.]